MSPRLNTRLSALEHRLAIDASEHDNGWWRRFAAALSDGVLEQLEGLPDEASDERLYELALEYARSAGDWPAGVVSENQLQRKDCDDDTDSRT